MKKSHKKVVLPPIFPADPVAAEYCQWFWSSSSGWDWISGTAPMPQTKTSWKTENKFPIQPLELWSRFLDPNEAIGVRFKKNTSYLLLDIDRHSPNHPANNPSLYMELIYTLREIGLTGYVAVSSTWSGGIHLFFPLPRPVDALRLAIRARLILESQGFKIKSGELELFPNTKSYAKKGEEYSKFNGHRLPLQPGSGSYLLDEALEPGSERVEDLLKAFRQQASRQDMERLESGLDADYEKFKKCRFNGANCSTPKWQRYLESARKEGWTGYGQTNSLLLLFGAYARVFLKLEGKKLADKIVEMATSAPGYAQYCQHQHEIERRALDVAQSAERYYWKQGSEPSRSGTYAEHFHPDRGKETSSKQQGANNIANFYTAAEAQNRIQRAVAHLEELGKLPSTTASRSVAIITTARELTGKGISQTTLQKNRHLWHPNHYQSTGECVQQPCEPVSGDFDPDVTSEPKPEKKAKPAQGADVHTPPLYEGCASLKSSNSGFRLEILKTIDPTIYLLDLILALFSSLLTNHKQIHISGSRPLNINQTYQKLNQESNNLSISNSPEPTNQPINAALSGEPAALNHHQILLRYQESLMEVDLNAATLQQAIAAYPQNLENAILAWAEASARRQIDSNAATDYLLNAIRKGWKPKSAPTASIQVKSYVLYPLMTAQAQSRSLAELVVLKRHLWENAPILRPIIQQWIEETPGVVMGMDGPELVDDNHQIVYLIFWASCSQSNTSSRSCLP